MSSIKQSIEKIQDFANDLLKMGNKSIIGIDIGLSQVKVAEVKRAGSGFKLLNYVAIDLPEGSLIEDDIQKADEVTKAIELAVDQLKTSSQNVAIGLFGPNTVAKKLQIPGGSNEEIDDQVSWEAEQYLPFNVEESSIAFHVFGENEGGGVDVLLAAARSDILEMFKELVENSSQKLKVKIVDLSIVAVTNVFNFVLKDRVEDPTQSYIFIDIGAQKTDFIIWKKNGIVFAKEVPIGGVIITEEIQRQMGVNYIEAEELKIIGDENGNLPEEIVEIVEDILDSFFSEIKKTIDFYITSSSDDSISECFVTGGGSLIPGAIEGLEATLNIPVTILSPFEKMDYDKKKFTDDQINHISFRGCTAIGLAMREL